MCNARPDVRFFTSMRLDGLQSIANREGLFDSDAVFAQMSQGDRLDALK